MRNPQTQHTVLMHHHGIKHLLGVRAVRLLWHTLACPASVHLIHPSRLAVGYAAGVIITCVQLPLLRCRIKHLGLHDLSTLLWALAQLQLQPPADILSELCEVSLARVGACDVTHFTNIAWALGRLQAAPEQEWLDAAEAASLQVGGMEQ